MRRREGKDWCIENASVKKMKSGKKERKKERAKEWESVNSDAEKGEC